MVCLCGLFFFQQVCFQVHLRYVFKTSTHLSVLHVAGGVAQDG